MISFLILIIPHQVLASCKGKKKKPQNPLVGINFQLEKCHNSTTILLVVLDSKFNVKGPVFSITGMLYCL